VLEGGPATQGRVVQDFFGAPAVTSAAPQHSESAMAIKRLFDLAVASALLILCAPLMAAIALLVKLSSPGPVFFTQVRSGMNGRRFRMIKFRTMVDGAESLIRHSHNSITRGPVFKDPNDYRITPLGRYLRRLSLDELPQLFNVLKGDMSMVGPRPLPVHEADSITGENRRRFSVPPGITCVWQVNGRSNVSYETWMTYDLQYVDKWSIWADTRLLFQTVPAVLLRRGAY
ncbi:MAG: sugar transferase, partial [Acidobacteriota bacterium]|nr:sugar transferase [Acidobacteriota bacterium]